MGLWGVHYGNAKGLAEFVVSVTAYIRDHTTPVECSGVRWLLYWLDILYLETYVLSWALGHLFPIENCPDAPASHTSRAHQKGCGV
jgi:hypothetical protein